ncbi:MAG: transporter [Roseivirga sp.]|nr:transporter [Roseivirga sp.]
MNKVCSFLLLSFASLSALAQSETQPEIITDRPSQTESAFVMPRGYFQIETGVLYSQGGRTLQAADGRVRFLESEQFTYNTSLFRYGLTDKLELRLIQGIGNEKFSTRSTGVQLGSTMVGMKLHLADAMGARPQISFSGLIGGPVFSNEESGTQADFRLNFQHSLSERLVLGYNLGGTLENDANDFNFLYTFVLGYNLTPKLYSYAEVYGSFSELNASDNGNLPANHEFDLGLAYRVNSHLQLDIFGGTAISDIGVNAIFGLGLSFRIPRKN